MRPPINIATSLTLPLSPHPLGYLLFLYCFSRGGCSCSLWILAVPCFSGVCAFLIAFESLLSLRPHLTRLAFLFQSSILSSLACFCSVAPCCSKTLVFLSPPTTGNANDFLPLRTRNRPPSSSPCLRL